MMIMIMEQTMTYGSDSCYMYILYVIMYNTSFTRIYFLLNEFSFIPDDVFFNTK